MIGRRRSSNPDFRPAGLRPAEDAAEYWLLRVEAGTAYHCPDCGGVRANGESGVHCTPESRALMTVQWLRAYVEKEKR